MGLSWIRQWRHDTNGGFLKMRYPQFSSISRWDLHEINHPATFWGTWPWKHHRATPCHRLAWPVASVSTVAIRLDSLIFFGKSMENDGESMNMWSIPCKFQKFQKSNNCRPTFFSWRSGAQNDEHGWPFFGHLLNPVIPTDITGANPCSYD